MKPGKWVSDCLKKNKYPSMGYAKRVRSEAKKKRDVDLRIYYCSHCNGYHLTSKI